jgi:hypothetical protein
MSLSSTWSDIRPFLVSGIRPSNPVSCQIPDFKKGRIIRPDIRCIPINGKQYLRISIKNYWYTVPVGIAMDNLMLLKLCIIESQSTVHSGAIGLMPVLTDFRTFQ